MKPIIKTLLIRRSNEEGFIIPTVIALGLIMLLIGTINIFKSNDEHITAIVQRDTREALTAAEAGVAYYREFIDNYKTIAEYNSTDAANTPSWSDRNGDDSTDDDDIPGIADSAGNPRDICQFDRDGNSGTNAVAEYDNVPKTGWRNIDGSEGQFQLVSYDYDAATNTGTLTVDGRDGNTTDSATTRLQVQFPIQPGLKVGEVGTQITDDLNNLDPVLWIDSDAISSMSDNISVNGNILISKDDCQLTGTTLTTAKSLGNISATPLAFPSTLPPSIPTASGDSSVNDVLASEISTKIKNQSLPLKNVTQNSRIAADGTHIFYYFVDGNLDFNNEDLEIQKNTEVIIYVNGNLTFEGDVDINQVPSTNTSEHLEIYVSNAGNIEFRGNGTINIKAFIHAPGSTVNSTSGGGDPTVNITGAMWVKDWNDTTSNAQKVIITPDNRYLTYTSLRNSSGQSQLLIKPVIYPPTSWITQQVP